MTTMGQSSYGDICLPDGHLANRRPFKGNTMSATIQRGRDTDLDYLSHCGQLYRHPEIQRQMREDADNGLHAVYVVWSYNTPIAYVRNDGVVVIPDVKYSRTTSRQQSYCRGWLKASQSVDA